ncbi:FecR family protein [Sphingobacterium allocomposti]|uniref:FecR family protein n=1 Tax=Sphingobacterium allocomposti TaxID=415956 RepID=A0A5S5DKN6_9SPHI|nr:FecR domain-containing protein [Sphingobacterium composti Yoo et al. 2007 non Ten et al. 2007]TYP96235.1 FecR family protein [Sphingobacterium composti Yoo et al. 2007 non Ten et al. 2007]
MEKHPHSITLLFRKFLQNRCSPEELNRLYYYFDIDENENLLKEIILEELDRDLDSEESPAQAQHLADLFDRISEKAQISEEQQTLKKRRWFGRRASVAAAAIVFVTMLTAISYWQITNTTQPKIAEESVVSYPKPGTDKAILTLFNGKEIILTDAKQDQILAGSGITISNNTEGLVVYQVDQSTLAKDSGAQLNTIRTPRGGQYQIVLADGTKVWLNASSSLIFPSHFSGDKRGVKLEGEAYFEVAHDAAKPFLVQTAESEVEVLGTSFNVMAYPEEQKNEITLLTGSVNVKKGKEARRLIPGQQAEIQRKETGIRVGVVDIEPIIAWKNGVFLFDQSELPQVMRQIGRWYDAEVAYEKEIPDVKLTGMVSRDDSLAVLLDILERAGGVSFDVQKNKIMVKQSN